VSLEHPFEPVFDKNSSILILGTFPSIKSREYGFYYGHPQNRFWKILACVTRALQPHTIEGKKRLLLKNRIALWDVLRSCDIKGSRDHAIQNPVPVDLSSLLACTNITHIFANGNKTFQMLNKYYDIKVQQKTTKLPSTSAANARYKFEELVSSWQCVAQAIVHSKSCSAYARRCDANN
jgi:hypoxanthine-DNA glycosylase